MASSTLCIELRRTSHTSIGKDMLLRMSRHFPYFAQGKVVKGFGRGSKELGIPTGSYNTIITIEELTIYTYEIVYVGLKTIVC